VSKNKNIINIVFIVILIIIFTIRFISVSHNGREDLIEKYKGKVVDVKGYISSEPLIKDFTRIFILKVINIDGEKLDISIKVSTERYIEYKYGQVLNLKGKLSIPFNFKSNGGRTFDYVDFLLKDGIYFEMKKPAIDIVSSDGGNFISKKLFDLKQGFLLNLKRVLGEPHSALAGGLVVGEKSALGKELIDDFRKSGLIHIVVLSGYNITIVADSIRRILSFLPRNISIVLGGLGIVAFGILVGGGAARSLMREDHAILQEIEIGNVTRT
jgi:competence protein ComEC